MIDEKGPCTTLGDGGEVGAMHDGVKAGYRAMCATLLRATLVQACRVVVALHFRSSCSRGGGDAMHARPGVTQRTNKAERQENGCAVSEPASTSALYRTHHMLHSSYNTDIDLHDYSAHSLPLFDSQEAAEQYVQRAPRLAMLTAAHLIRCPAQPHRVLRRTNTTGGGPSSRASHVHAQWCASEHRLVKCVDYILRDAVSRVTLCVELSEVIRQRWSRPVLDISSLWNATDATSSHSVTDNAGDKTSQIHPELTGQTRAYTNVGNHRISSQQGRNVCVPEWDDRYCAPCEARSVWPRHMDRVDTAMMLQHAVNMDRIGGNADGHGHEEDKHRSTNRVYVRPSIWHIFPELASQSDQLAELRGAAVCDVLTTAQETTPKTKAPPPLDGCENNGISNIISNATRQVDQDTNHNGVQNVIDAVLGVDPGETLPCIVTCGCPHRWFGVDLPSWLLSIAYEEHATVWCDRARLRRALQLWLRRRGYRLLRRLRENNVQSRRGRASRRHRRAVTAATEKCTTTTSLAQQTAKMALRTREATRQSGNNAIHDVHGTCHAELSHVDGTVPMPSGVCESILVEAAPEISSDASGTADGTHSSTGQDGVTPCSTSTATTGSSTAPSSHPREPHRLHRLHKRRHTACTRASSHHRATNSIDLRANRSMSTRLNNGSAARSSGADAGTFGDALVVSHASSRSLSRPPHAALLLLSSARAHLRRVFEHWRDRVHAHSTIDDRVNDHCALRHHTLSTLRQALHHWHSRWHARLACRRASSAIQTRHIALLQRWREAALSRHVLRRTLGRRVWQLWRTRTLWKRYTHHVRQQQQIQPCCGDQHDTTIARRETIHVHGSQKTNIRIHCETCSNTNSCTSNSNHKIALLLPSLSHNGYHTHARVRSQILTHWRGRVQQRQARRYRIRTVWRRFSHRTATHRLARAFAAQRVRMQCWQLWRQRQQHRTALRALQQRCCREHRLRQPWQHWRARWVWRAALAAQIAARERWRCQRARRMCWQVWRVRWRCSRAYAILRTHRSHSELRHCWWVWQRRLHRRLDVELHRLAVAQELCVHWTRRSVWQRWQNRCVQRHNSRVAAAEWRAEKMATSLWVTHRCAQVWFRWRMRMDRRACRGWQSVWTMTSTMPLPSRMAHPGHDSNRTCAARKTDSSGAHTYHSNAMNLHSHVDEANKTGAASVGMRTRCDLGRAVRQNEGSYSHAVCLHRVLLWQQHRREERERQERQKTKKVVVVMVPRVRQRGDDVFAMPLQESKERGHEYANRENASTSCDDVRGGGVLFSSSPRKGDCAADDVFYNARRRMQEVMRSQTHDSHNGSCPRPVRGRVEDGLNNSSLETVENSTRSWIE